jgi:tRNA threonylcarbamoyladenosine biosynthesis protein TsaB
MVHVLLLAADTSSPSGSLAILRDEMILGLIHTVSDEPYSSRLFRHLDLLLRDLSLDLKDFDLVAVSSGPGSFTGLRVGLSAAKAWAEAYAKPVCGLSTLEAVAAQSRSSAPMLVPVLDARRQQLYYGFYHRPESGAGLKGEEKVGSHEEFRKDLDDHAKTHPCTIVSTDRELLRSELAARHELTRNLEIVSPILAPWIARLALSQSREGNLSNSFTLDANYIRRSDAELHWKGP